MNIEGRERSALLDLARRSIARGIDGRGHGLPPGDWTGAMLEHRATFTTLKMSGELRGCCGTIEPRRPLVEDVWHSAWTSAFADPRFQPVSEFEIGLLEISISVLTPLEPLDVRGEAELVRALVPGEDGIVIRSGLRQAMFLPAVWDAIPDPREFVVALKRKAGWPAFGWPTGATVLRYRTESFCSDGRGTLGA
jgi:AmmeMemoRadiSam system protein A